MNSVSDTKDTAASFWEKQKDSVYYCILQSLHKNLIRTPQSILDVGPGNKSPLGWLQSESKTSTDTKNPYVSDDVESVTANFLTWRPEKKFQVITCLHIMERAQRPETYAQKLLRLGKLVIVSVPYKLAKEHAGSQLHSNIDEKTMKEWFGREPNFSYVCRELKSNSDRLIQVYEKTEGKWSTFSERNTIRTERAKNLTVTESSPRDLGQFKKPLSELESVEGFYKEFRPIDSAYSIKLNETFLDLEIHARKSDTIAFFLMEQ
jgi:hypothetical protein